MRRKSLRNTGSPGARDALVSTQKFPSATIKITNALAGKNRMEIVVDDHRANATNSEAALPHHTKRARMLERLALSNRSKFRLIIGGRTD